MNISDLPEFTPAGRANLLMQVARLSGASLIQEPEPQPWFGKFCAGLVVGAAVTALLMVAA